MKPKVLRVEVKVKGLIATLTAKQASSDGTFLSHMTGPFFDHVLGRFPAMQQRTRQVFSQSGVQSAKEGLLWV